MPGHANTSRKRDTSHNSPDDYQQFPRIIEISGKEKNSDLDTYGAV